VILPFAASAGCGHGKAAAEDVLVRITAHNRSPEAATLHLPPTLWFRNTWSWPEGTPKPGLRAAEARGGTANEALGRKVLLCEREGLPVLVVENETNETRVLGRHGGTRFPKDGINDCVVNGQQETVNPEQTGTKGAMYWQVTVPAGDGEDAALHGDRLGVQACIADDEGAPFACQRPYRRSWLAVMPGG
jgi:hypothetical protein